MMTFDWTSVAGKVHASPNWFNECSISFNKLNTTIPALPCCQFINQVKMRSVVNIYVNPLLFRLFMLAKSVFVPGLFIQEKFGSKQGPK